MANLKLTDTERLILANQYEIMSLLNKDDHYALMAETLRSGYEWLYRQYFDDLDENLDPEKAEYVLTILGIYGDMHSSFAKMEDKSSLDESQLIFPGFDGNNESELLCFTHALLKHDRFINTIGPAARNSHMPTTQKYRRMIQKWEELGRPHFPYTKDHIIAILEP